MGRRYRSNRRSYGGSRSVGLERALQHIEDAKNLTRELGGTDADVKQYFFNLPKNQLNGVFDAYEQAFGAEPRQYAEKTLPAWRSGRVKMSGTVAERLFRLLPPRMPLREKYRLTENLWEHFGPKSKKRLRLGLNVDPAEVVRIVKSHLDDVVISYKIPQQMENRFNWLSGGDVSVKQELLNHMKTQERQLVAEGVKLQLPLMIQHLQADEENLTTRMAQTLKVGKHEVELLVDRNAEGANLEEWMPSLTKKNINAASSDSNWGTWIVVLLMIGILAKCYGG
ncbi:hypothetical protein [Parasphingorhabdus sp.]|jgi:hypothetical protein|uniref:hypothetical protein n=1 Tax=Parasphingorhabdus sp. TaxID=2709688 RepID=UPI003D27BB29